MTLEYDSSEFPESAVPPAATTTVIDRSEPADGNGRESADAAALPPPGTAQGNDRAAHADSADDGTPALLAGLSAEVRRLADSSAQYHARAEQREGVIDHLRSELEQLRRGERRGLLRPLLVEICRLRDDLLRQADGLPGDFDTERAGLLLRSYAESVEIALENSGVIAFAPAAGDPFEPRMHRQVGGVPGSDPALAGRVAQVRRSGYLDVEASRPISPAEVVLFRAVSTEPADISAPGVQADPAATDPEMPRPASGTDQRNEL